MTTTSNSLNTLDLASFEPEAILASVPGEHPKAAAVLGVAREASQTGHIDIDVLSKIANELYSEGFPTQSPFGGPTIGQPNAVPETDSLSHDLAQQPVTLPLHAFSPPGIQDGLGGAPLATSPQAEQASGHALGGHALYLQHAPAFDAGFDVSSLLGGVEIPHQADLLQLFSSPLSAQSNAVPSLGSLGSAGLPKSGSQANSPYYFVQGHPSAAHAVNPAAGIAPSAHPPFDVNLVRKDFPILRELVNGHPLIWFDNAATTQKPQCVIDRISYFYQHENSNIHRAAHELAARATDAYEEARETVRRFINAPSVNNIVFVRGTTEAINLVAKTWGKKHLGEGDEILVSHLEHHANIVPWQQLVAETGATLKVAPVDDHGQVLLEEYQKLLTPRTKLVAFTQVSNALGTVTPAREMIQMAHRVGAKVLLDGAQSVSHMRSDVQGLDPDFFVFSGHKIFGPTGIGALYGKEDVLADMPAWQGGGNMIQEVTFEKTVYHPAPAKFEAGTGNIADAVGLGAALQYVEHVGIENIARYEHELLVYATAAMSQVSGLTLIGTAKEKASVLSFALKGYKSEEVGAALNEEGIAVRSGHHCAQPILRRFGLETTVRPSLAFYNTFAEIDAMVAVLHRLSSGKG